MTNAHERLNFIIGRWNVTEEYTAFDYIGEGAKGFVISEFPLTKARGTAHADWAIGRSAIIYQRHSEGFARKQGVAPGGDDVLHTFSFSTERVTCCLTLGYEHPTTIEGQFRERSLHFRSRKLALGKYWRDRWRDSLVADPEAEGDGALHVVYRPLSEHTWVLCTMHAFEDEQRLLVLKSLIWHRRAPDATPEESKAACTLIKAQSAPSLVQDIESEIEKTQAELNDARARLQESRDELEVCEDGIRDLEFAELGVDDQWATERETDPYQRERRLQELYQQLAELPSEIQSAEHDVEDLEIRLDDLEWRLDQADEEWTNQAAEIAEEAFNRAQQKPGFARPPLTEDEELFLSCISPEARLKFESCQWAMNQGESSKPRDKSYVMGCMCSYCERIFKDAFAQRRGALRADPAVRKLAEHFKKLKFEIPSADTAAHVDKAAAGRVLNMILGNDEPRWSGMRNCAIALLLLGRQYKVSNGVEIEIDNPLDVDATEEECRDLRLALYELQEIRNPFIHGDVATWEHVVAAKKWFERCWRGIIRLLYPRVAGDDRGV